MLSIISSTSMDEKFVLVAKKLADNDNRIRGEAITSVEEMISSFTDETSLAPIQMLKLWKGLFYCMWMSDKPFRQQKLAKEIAAFTCIFKSNTQSLLFIQCFIRTMSREWSGIDYLRLDKFYFLFERMLVASIEWLQEEEFNEDCVNAFYDVIKMELLSEYCLKHAAALSYSFVEKFELAVKETGCMNSEYVENMLRMTLKFSRKTRSKCFKRKVEEHIVEPMVKAEYLMVDGSTVLDEESSERLKKFAMNSRA